MNTSNSKASEKKRTVAYFSMEIGLDSAIPTYSGGLGVLAGDTVRAAADLGVPMVGVTLLYRKGYFRQHLDGDGNQSESPYEWNPESFLVPLKSQATCTMNGRTVHIRVWKYEVQGINGHAVPVYFLDTALQENDSWDQTLTDHLYGGDAHYRLCQETLLGIGGMAMLAALGYENIQVCHMNEGHSALLVLALLEGEAKGRGLQLPSKTDIDEIRKHCVFTTHTPIPAGHDKFSTDLVERVLGEERTRAIETLGCLFDKELNMTYLGMFFSHYINGVSMRHEQISQDMFPNYPLNSITNGVHAITWTSAPFCQLYDSHIPEWRQDNRYLRYAVSIPLDEIQHAHAQAKRELFQEVEQRTGLRLDHTVITLGFARRATQYKQAHLLFSN
ncbi:MAG: alpha-glucan family phosphorylase, partial [Gemmatimonadota bacterium]